MNREPTAWSSAEPVWRDAGDAGVKETEERDEDDDEIVDEDFQDRAAALLERMNAEDAEALEDCPYHRGTHAFGRCPDYYGHLLAEREARA